MNQQPPLDPAKEIDVSKEVVERAASYAEKLKFGHDAQLLRALAAKVEQLESEAVSLHQRSKQDYDRALLLSESVIAFGNRAQLAEQRLAAAVEALKPFAKAASRVSPGHKTAFVFVDDLRHATATLQLQESSHDTEKKEV